MQVGILGAGNVGGALGKGWAARGHDIVFGVRDVNDRRNQELLQRIGSRARAATLREAATASEVVVLATPWPAAEDAIKSAGDLREKVLIDATNPLKSDLSGLAIGLTTSAAEQVAGWARGARVVKAFNTIGSMHMTDPRFGTERASMFICGDDAAAKKTVATLTESLGFDPVDAGPLTQARLLEPLAMLWISMALAYGHGPNIAFKLLRR